MTILAPDDALAILQLVAKADTLATHRDVGGYVALFTEDAVMDGDLARACGRDAPAGVVQHFSLTTAGWRINSRHITMRSTAPPAGGQEERQ